MAELRGNTMFPGHHVRAYGIGTALRGGQKRATGIYLSLNPAELKRQIDAKLEKLYNVYEEKRKTQQVDHYKKLVPHIVRNYMIQQSPVGLGT